MPSIPVSVLLISKSEDSLRVLPTAFDIDETALSTPAVTGTGTV